MASDRAKTADAPAPYHAEIARGPENGAAFWLRTDDGLRIRLGVWDGRGVDAPKGTVLICPGRTEYVEKYGVCAKLLQDHGYSSVAIDWRGQGLADRLLDDRMLGHVTRFSDYQIDLRAVMDKVAALNMPEPYFIYGHSMGGCISMRAVIDGLKVNAAMFTGPMWDIELESWKRMLGGTLAAVSRKANFDTLLMPGSLRSAYVEANPFPDNMLTSDPDMYAFLQDQLKACPELALGGPTYAWVNEALKACKALSLTPSPDIPAITFLGTNERIVSPDAIRDRMNRWPGGILRLVDGGEHEVAMESPKVQAKIFEEACALFDTTL